LLLLLLLKKLPGPLRGDQGRCFQRGLALGLLLLGLLLLGPSCGCAFAVLIVRWLFLSPAAVLAVKAT
jgi:hypothetical protein